MYRLQGGRRFDIVKEQSARQCRCREVRKGKVVGEVLEAVAMSPVLRAWERCRILC